MLYFPKSAYVLQGLPLAAVTAALSLPGFLVKQIINCFQLRSSMQVGAVRAWNSGRRLLGLNPSCACMCCIGLLTIVDHCTVTVLCVQALVQYDKDREAQEVASTAAKMQ